MNTTFADSEEEELSSEEYDKGIYVATWTIFTLSATIYIPLVIYFVYPLFALRTNIIFKKRYITLSLMGILLLFLQAMNRIIWPLIIVTDEWSARTINFICSAIDLFCSGCYIDILLLRYWLIYFDINHSILLSNGTWKSVIDQNWNEDNNFFLKHHDKWGNYHFFKKFLWISIALNLVLSIIVYVTCIYLPINTYIHYKKGR